MQDPAAYQSKRAAARSSLAIAKQPAETSRQKRAKQYAYTLLVLITLLCHGCIGQPGARLGMGGVISSFLFDIDDPLEILESNSEWEVLFASMGASHCWEAIQSAQSGRYRLAVGRAIDRANKVAGVAIRYLARYKSDDVIELEISSRHANPLTELDPAIGALTRLESLELGANQLEYLPPEIGALTSLNNLSIHNNQLKELPPEIGALTNLSSLHLGSNQLKDVSSLQGMTNLMWLNLFYNRLKELPPEIGALTRLNHLFLRNNQLKELPPEIGALTNLTTLSLANNQLKCMSEKLHSWWMDIPTKPHRGNPWLEHNGLEVINDNADATNFVRQQAKAFMHEGHRKLARRLAQYREQYENNEKEGICRYLHHSTNNTGSWEQGKRIIFFEDEVPFYLDRQLITQEDIDTIPDRGYYHRGP